jgi:hypothetical protein
MAASKTHPAKPHSAEMSEAAKATASEVPEAAKAATAEAVKAAAAEAVKAAAEAGLGGVGPQTKRTEAQKSHKPFCEPARHATPPQQKMHAPRRAITGAWFSSFGKP